MLRKNHDMLTSVLETFKTAEVFVPFGDHSSLEKSWYTENANLLYSTYKEFEPNPRKDVGRALEFMTDAYSLFLQKAENTEWQKKSVEERKAKVETIKRLPQVEQRTEAWYRQYAEVLTASEFSSLFSGGKKRKDLVFSKVQPKLEDTRPNRLACRTEEMNPFAWGIRFEPVIKQIIEHKDQCKIYESGRLVHATNSKLAASPDGIIESSPHKHQVGRLIEIKCPYTRKIGGEIPFDYWVQMQIQMEVADIDECEYIEVEIVSKRGENQVDLSGTSLQGNVYLVQTDVVDGEAFEYKYLYSEIGSNTVPPLPEGFRLVETIPWGMKKWHRKIVKRDRVWYAATLPWQEAFWTDVERAKQNEELLVPYTNEPKKSICLIKDDSE
jgi:hypothetical protein